MNMPMSMDTLVALLALLVTVATATGGAVVFLMRKSFRTEMRNEQFLHQIEVRVGRQTRQAFDKLRKLVKEASDALGADKASLYFPEPPMNPSYLKIVFSTDPKSKSVVGRHIPMSEGISGWVYKTKQPYIQNDVASDPRHSRKSMRRLVRA